MPAADEVSQAPDSDEIASGVVTLCRNCGAENASDHGACWNCYHPLKPLRIQATEAGASAAAPPVVVPAGKRLSLVWVYAALVATIAVIAGGILYASRQHRNRLFTERWSRGAELEAQGNLAAALGEYLSALSLDRDSLAVRLKVARLYAKMHRYEQASAAYREVLRAHTAVPGLAQELASLGISLNQAGQYRLAEQVFKSALDLDPNLVDARFQWGVAAGQLGKYEDAIAAFMKVLDARPASNEARTNLAVAYLRAGRWLEAQAQCEKALNLNPKDAVAHNCLASAYTEARRYEDAADEFRKALALEPKFVEAYNGMGLLEARQGKYDQAIEHFETALRIKPDYAEAHNNLGLAYYKKGNLDRAIDEYWEAVGCDPSYTTAFYNLGWAYQQKGQVGKAVNLYRQALAIDPDFAMARYGLAHSLQVQGDNAAAVEEYLKALELDDSVSAATPARYNLAVAYDALHQPQKALEQLDKYIQGAPGKAPSPQLLDFKDRLLHEVEESREH